MSEPREIPGDHNENILRGIGGIERLRMHKNPDSHRAADRIELWHEALQKIATGKGDGIHDAEVMRGIASEALMALS